MRWTTLGMAIAAPLAVLAVVAALLLGNQLASIGPVAGWLAIPLFALSPLVAATTWREVSFGARLGLSAALGIVASVVMAATYWQPLLHPDCVYGPRVTPWEVALPVIVAGAVFGVGWAAAALVASSLHAAGRPWHASSAGVVVLLAAAFVSTLLAFAIGGGLCNHSPG